MTTDATPHATTDCRIALLIDADNVSHTKMAAMLAELSRYGTANIRRAYGDWTAPGLKGWREKLHDFAIRPIQQFSYTAGKNATDIALVIDAMELLYTQQLDAFCIASSDADFTPLVMQLRANGRTVYGFGERKTPAPFARACTTFLYLDSLVDPDAPTAAPASDEPAPATNDDRPTPTQESPADRRRTLAQDSALVIALRGGVEAAERDDGWAPLGAAGNAVKRAAPIDPRNYGAKNFRALYEATGLFEIIKADNGQPFVADKRNRDRTPRPTG